MSEDGGVEVGDKVLALENLFEGMKMDVAIGTCGIYAGAQLHQCTDQVLEAIAEMFLEHMKKGAAVTRDLLAEMNNHKEGKHD